MVPEANVLLVADWAIDPGAVVAAASARVERGTERFHVLVPAWLHRLDWMGDPTVSVPCAEAQAERLRERLDDAGIEHSGVSVGDPDPVTAMCDALADRQAGEILICAHGRRLTGLRAARATGLPVERVDAPFAVRRGHCAAVAA
jgi:hypothetical protein